MNPVDFNINELMRRVLIKYEGRIEEKNMEVEADFAGEPCTVHADVDRIEQVVSNLVDNAIKFCGQYGRLTLRTKVEKGTCIVSVIDDGAGIDEKRPAPRVRPLLHGGQGAHLRKGHGPWALHRQANPAAARS